jgi:ABC-type Zn uptake system ZnuABC Zn-binding protein ZnuA
MLTKRIGAFFLVAIFMLTGCSPTGSAQHKSEAATGGKFRVVATTTIVGDVVRNIAGDWIDLHILIPPGVDEHSFQYTPEDVAKVAGADIVFMNGAGLETFMKPLVENAGQHAKVISVSDGITLMQAADLTGETARAGGQSSTGGDPHVWLDPNNIQVWTKNIAATLGELDPAHAAAYQANALKYQQNLSELDGWIQQQTAQVPEENRRLVTDHEIFTYFANRYGFKQIGALIPSYSTAAEPSAKELAGIEDAIRQYGVKAIFVGNTVNPDLSKRVAKDTGVALIPIYTGSLTSGAPGGTYLDYMRYNVEAIVNALK